MGLYFWILPGFLDSIATGGTIAAGTAAIALYAVQRRLIYIPQYPPGSRHSIWKPSQFGWKNFDEIWLNSKDGTRIHAFWMPNSANGEVRSVPTIYFCHVIFGLLIF
jgi:abhydrolase domain-containing protein 13